MDCIFILNVIVLAQEFIDFLGRTHTSVQGAGGKEQMSCIYVV
jgi:hypothetical protein